MAELQVSPKDLFYAIALNDSTRVNKYMEEDKADPNMNLAEQVPARPTVLKRRRGTGGSYLLSPLHFAVFHAILGDGRIGRLPEHKLEAKIRCSTSILRSLLRSGADTEAKTRGDLWFAKDPQKPNFTAILPRDVTAIGLAFHLAYHLSESKQIALQEAIRILYENPLPKKLLLCDDSSDVRIACCDRVVLPAHKCVLAASSPYWKTALAGPWTENANGVWNTVHSSSTMKNVLSYVYTGEFDDTITTDDWMALLAAAHEFQLGTLQNKTVNMGIQHLCLDNLKETLQTACFYGIEAFKKACFDFAVTNKAKALKNPNVMSIATDDPQIWEELKTYIGAEGDEK